MEGNDYSNLFNLLLLSAYYFAGILIFWILQLFRNDLKNRTVFKILRIFSVKLKAKIIEYNSLMEFIFQIIYYYMLFSKV